MSTAASNVQTKPKTNSTTASKTDPSTVQRVATAVHGAVDNAVEKAEPMEQKLRDQANKAGETLEARQAAASDKMQQSLQDVEKFVKERPVAATGIAFAAGVLAAVILRR